MKFVAAVHHRVALMVLLFFLLTTMLAGATSMDSWDKLYQEGRRTLQGKGETKDRARGLALIQKAAEAGHMDAQLYLAMSFYEGTYGVHDIVQAVYWLRKAAEQGSTEAQEILELLTAEV